MWTKIADAADKTASTMLKTLQLFNPLIQAGAARKQDYYQRRQMSIQNGYNRELMAFQYDLNRMALDYANEYNLPINQVKRLLEAGINPASLSGMGEGGAMASSGLPSSSIGSPGLPDMRYSSPGAANWMGISEAESKINLNNALARRADVETEENFPVMRDLMKSQMRNYDKQSGLADAQTIYQNALADIVERSADDQVEGYRLRNDLTAAQIDQTVANFQKTLLESEDLRFKIETMNPVEYQQALADLRYTIQAIALAKVQRELTAANVKFTEEGVQNLIAERTGVELQNEYEERTMESRVGKAGWEARTAKRNYRWLPWKNVAGIVSDIIGSVMSIYSKGASAGQSNAERRLLEKKINSQGYEDYEEDSWFDPATNTRHTSRSSRRY